MSTPSELVKKYEEHQNILLQEKLEKERIQDIEIKKEIYSWYYKCFNKAYKGVGSKSIFNAAKQGKKEINCHYLFPTLLSHPMMETKQHYCKYLKSLFNNEDKKILNKINGTSLDYVNYYDKHSLGYSNGGYQYIERCYINISWK